MPRPLRSTGITPLHHYYRAVRPSPAHRYFQPRGCSRLRFSLGIAGQVLTFRTRARLSFAPPTCRMPLGQSQCIPQTYPGRWVSPRFWHRLIRFRHFNSGSLALASLNHACRTPWSGFSATLPSRPREFHPEPLTDSGLETLASSGSCHHAKAVAFRRELELLLLPVGSLPTSGACPLSSTSITPASSLLWGSPSLIDASVLSTSRGLRLRLFPSHHRPGSQVPCESPNESHAS